MTSTQSKSKEQIIEFEKRLLDAFGDKDIAVLNELIHEDALFVLPNGLTVTKPMVIDNYRSGNMAMTAISSDQKINLIDDTAIVSINLELNGKYFEQQVSSKFRYIRVWKLFGGAWKVIATSGVPINKQ